MNLILGALKTPSSRDFARNAAMALKIDTSLLLRRGFHQGGGTVLNLRPHFRLHVQSTYGFHIVNQITSGHLHSMTEQL